MGYFKLFSCGLARRGVNLRRVCRVVYRASSSANPPPPGTATGGDCSSDASEKTGEGAKVQASSGEGKAGLVLGVYESGNDFELTAAAGEVNQKSGGKLCKSLSELGCELKLGKAFVVTDLGDEYGPVAIASYGPKDAGFNELEVLDEARENLRWGVGAGVRALTSRGVTAVSVDTGDHVDAAAEAATLASWNFDSLRSSGWRTSAVTVSALGADAGADAGAWRAGLVRADGQNWARYLADMPANKMTPTDVAQAALDVLCPLGVQVTAREQDWIIANNMEAFLHVARGSCEAPIFLELEYRGGGGSNILVAAKGVTFDSGGLCLKSTDVMRENRGSMAGAAVTLAVFKILATLKAPVNLMACIPLCENMISGQCMKVGDVVRALNGLSIEIEDTDMEGRLMLADALVYGQALHKPAVVIDVATLTRGVLLATSGGAFGCISNNDQLWRAARAAGAHAGDRPWRLPAWDYYQRQITNSPAVDLRNRGSGKASACIGAAFLKNFICGDYLHLDITGVGKLQHGEVPPYLSPRRMSGRPTRTLAAVIMAIATGAGGEQPAPPRPCPSA